MQTPAVGVGLGGYTSADFDGATAALKYADSGADILATSAFYFSVMFRARAAPSPSSSGVAFDPLIFGDLSGNLGLSFSSSGAQAFLAPTTAGTLTTLTKACSKLDWHWVQVWHDGTNLNLQVDGGVPVSTPCALTYLTSNLASQSLRVGANVNSAFFNGEVVYVDAQKTARSSAQIAGVGSFLQQKYGYYLGFAGDAAIALASYPDVIVTHAPMLGIARLHSSRMQSVTVAARPERTKQIAQPVFPDHLYELHRVRRFMHAARMQAFAANTLPLLVVTTTFAQMRATYPDTIDRRQLARNGLHASRQQFTSGIAPLPLPVVTTTFAQMRAIGPEMIDRRQLARNGLHASCMQAYAAPIAPERTLASFDIEYPDGIDRQQLARNGMHTSRQQAYRAPDTLVVVAVVTPVDLVRFPDAPTRVLAHASRQLDRTSISPQPEQPVAMATVSIPKVLFRRNELPAHQLASTSLPSQPERTAPLATVIAPEYARRAPALSVAAQQAMGSMGSVAPEQPLPVSNVHAPEVVRRPIFRAEQQVAEPTFAPAPEQTTQLACVVGPEMVRRPFLRAEQQLASPVFAPAPEHTSPRDYSATHPDAIGRPKTPAAHQRETWLDPFPLPNVVAVTPVDLARFPDIAPARPLVRQAMTTPPPSPERTTPLADVFVPVRILRPTYPTTAQAAALSVPPAPEQTTQIACVVAPERVARPFLTTSQQRAVTEVPPQPEQPLLMAFVSAPERVIRPFVATARQIFTVPMAPAPEQPLPMAFVIAPDVVRRPVYMAPEQLAFDANRLPIPLPQFAASSGATYPDRVPRPSLRAELQQTFAFWPIPLPVAPLTQLQVGFVIAPDAVRRPMMAPSLQLATTSEPPAPERTLPMADVQAPVRIVRPFYPTTAQLAATAIPPRPEQTTQIGWTVAPETVRRPMVPASQQLAFFMAPQPEHRSPLDWSVLSPAEVRRPIFRAEQQRAFMTSSQPEQTSPLDFCVVAPEMVRRPLFAAYQQLAAVPPPQQPAPLIVHGYAPARVTRPMQRPEHQLAFATPFIAPILQSQFAPISIYPSAVARPWSAIGDLRVDEMQAALGVDPKPIPPFVSAHGATGQLVATQSASLEATVEANAVGGLTVKLAGAGVATEHDGAAATPSPTKPGAFVTVIVRRGAGKV